jgi:hypothetical protein
MPNFALPVRPAHGGFMNSITRHVVLVAGLALSLHVTSSWGANGSVYFDANGNAAAGETLFNATFTGVSNVGLGRTVLPNLTTGSQNTATGASALSSNTAGSNNTATGTRALQNNTTGNNNTASGASALLSNTSGSSNTACGVNALSSNTTGSSNTASGLSALQVNTNGSSNTACGAFALFSNSAGINNTAVGAKALKKSTGTKNIAIGFQAGVSLVNGNNNIYIGNQGAGDEFQTIRIGTAQAQTFIAAIASAGVTGAQVEVDDAGQLGVVLSSARYKEDIAPMGSRSEKMLELTAEPKTSVSLKHSPYTGGETTPHVIDFRCRYFHLPDRRLLRAKTRVNLAVAARR